MAARALGALAGSAALLLAGSAAAQTASCRRSGEAAQITVTNTLDRTIVCSMSCELSDRETPKRSFFCNSVVVKPHETGTCANIGLGGSPGIYNVTCSTQ